MIGTETEPEIKQQFCTQNCTAHACTGLACPRAFQNENEPLLEEPNEPDEDEMDFIDLRRFFRGGLDAK